MGERFRRFMYGRYGIDKLGMVLLIASMIITFLSSLFFSEGIIISYVLILWEVFRFLSRNTFKRSEENRKFLNIKNVLKKRTDLMKNKIRDRKTHRYFQCPTCHNVLRVPKGKGEIRATCPVCKTITITKT